jgi:multiple sugar transport system substrate-binding protein
MFDEAGIAYPDDTWNWNKFVEVSKKLTDPAKGVYGFAAPLNEQEGYANIIYQNGGYMISPDKKTSGYDKQETIDAIEWYIDLIYKEKVSPSLEQLAETDFKQMFESGKIAMVFMGSWMVPELKGNEYTSTNCDLAVLPKGQQRASIYNGLGNVIANNTKYPEECWKFLKFLGSEEANLIQAKNGAAIPAYKGTQQPWVEYTTNFNLKYYVDMLEYGVAYPTSKTRPKWEEVQNDVLRKVFAQDLSVEEGCKDLAKQMNEILAEE